MHPFLILYIGSLIILFAFCTFSISTIFLLISRNILMDVWWHRFQLTHFIKSHKLLWAICHFYSSWKVLPDSWLCWHHRLIWLASMVFAFFKAHCVNDFIKLSEVNPRLVSWLDMQYRIWIIFAVSYEIHDSPSSHSWENPSSNWTHDFGPKA